MRCNRRIRAKEVRVITETKEQLGVLSIDEALQKAVEAGKDLVEVSPTAEPPVCRIMDYGKFKYKQKKKEHQAKKKAHASQLKEIRLGPNIGQHDLDVKINRAKEFIEHHHKVLLSMLFRRREIAHTDLGRRIFEQFSEAMSEISKVESPIRREKRKMNMILAPKQK